MSFKGIDLGKLSKIASQQIEHLTCVECCKYYIAPETAECGHSLCHNCWRGRKTCPLCSLPVKRTFLRLNLPLQKLTGHVQTLAEAFEKLFDVKLEEFLLGTEELESENDPSKNVNDWLASSQNHFSAPPQSSQMSLQELRQNSNRQEVSPSKIQVHTITKKTVSPEKVMHISAPQDDWDRIEIKPAAEVVTNKNENIIVPMDIEPIYIDDNEYSANNPRRSSRKKEYKNDVSFNTYNNKNSPDKENKESSIDMDKRSNSAKQNWNNVKKMRKEFSKLNKKKNNKLNVSIEMCKKTQSTAKLNIAPPTTNTNSPQVYEIDENTPKHLNANSINNFPDNEMTKIIESNHHSGIDEKTNSKKTVKDNLIAPSCASNDYLSNQISRNKEQVTIPQPQACTETNLQNIDHEKEHLTHLPFYKKGALCTKSELEPHVEKTTTKTINRNIESNSNSHDDIEITIKVGNTIANIVIKQKNDVQIKFNSDRAIQTSLCPQQDGTANILPLKETRNVSISVDSNSEINIEQKQTTQQNKKQIPAAAKSIPVKKNTASADTGTGQFEITESVEKELSDIMECAEIEDQQKTKSVQNIAQLKSQIYHTQKCKSVAEKTQKCNTPKPLTELEKVETFQNSANLHTNCSIIQDDLEYLNDIDIFESDNNKNADVQLLKFSKNTVPSEILIPTAQTRNKTQKTTEKRYRNADDEDLPNSKKQKSNKTEISSAANKTSDNSKQSKQNLPESEALNYDSVMGKVFASIDADMKIIKSQNINSTKLTDKNDNNRSENNDAQMIIEESQKPSIMSEKNRMDCTSNSNYCDNAKDSENIFSVCVEKDDVIEASSAPKKDEANDLNAEDFLTPVYSRNHNKSNAATVENNVIEISNDIDDSESIVEDTPQKDTSIGRLKQNSKDLNQSQMKAKESRIVSGGSGQPTEPATIKTFANLVETSGNTRSCNNVTVIDAVAGKHTLETPLNINKFVDNITHNSTPIARKSLNFECEITDDDPEQTLCPTNITVAKTTLEKEFMCRAFEKTPTTQKVNTVSRSFGKTGRKKFCLAGSCLLPGELAKVKALCVQNKWSYVDKYTKDLTHLVVKVDEENKSLRTVKYMCALAASKWIVTNEWVEKCLQTKQVIGEEIYEALDCTGEPGPRRSRVANTKLFQGITFYCMEPFSIMDTDTLKEILESSGGRVVNEVKEVRITDGSSAPAILLAEPENTQENRFIYLAMELSIVPVNYEWVLNCLGSYTLGSIQGLLLCPSSLLPKATSKWPEELMAREDD